MAEIDAGSLIAQYPTNDEKLRGILTLLGDQITQLRVKVKSLEEIVPINSFAVLTPVQITANQNDYAIALPYNPGDLIKLRLSTDAARNVTGLYYADDGQLIFIVNVGANNLVLTHQDAASRAENRFICPGAANITLAATEGVIGWYDEITLRWRLWKL